MKYSELYRMLIRDGWFIHRQTGSHFIMLHPIKKDPVIFPRHGSSEVGKGLEMKIKKDAGLR